MRSPSFALSFLSACSALPTAAVVDDDGRVTARIENPPYRAADHVATCKVFHHVFAPDGRLLTKGLGGTYEHHRGLFVGWNRLHCGEQRYDFWHCRNGEHQRFVGFVPAATLALPDATQVAAIEWCTNSGVVVLAERRALRSRTIAPDVTALDLTIELTAPNEPVLLDGDAHHAGQQLRVRQEFADARSVRYVRPREAVVQPDDLTLGCAWIAAVLPLAEGPVTVLRCEGAHNPSPATWSARPYGRFGAMCKATVEPGRPLRLDYRYVIALGERDAAWCERMAAAWRPPTAASALNRPAAATRAS